MGGILIGSVSEKSKDYRDSRESKMFNIMFNFIMLSQSFNRKANEVSETEKKYLDGIKEVNNITSYILSIQAMDKGNTGKAPQDARYSIVFRNTAILYKILGSKINIVKSGLENAYKTNKLNEQLEEFTRSLIEYLNKNNPNYEKVFN